MYVYQFIFYRGDHIVPNMDEAFPKKKVEEGTIDRVSLCVKFFKTFYL